MKRPELWLDGKLVGYVKEIKIENRQRPRLGEYGWAYGKIEIEIGPEEDR